jgi:tellurium resistance protein terD
MAIDFSILDKSAPMPSEVAGNGGSSPISLEKNNIIDLSKAAPSLKRVKFTGGWDVAKKAGEQFDLDISVFCVDYAGKVGNLMTEAVWYKNLDKRGMVHSVDNRTGDGAGDDEYVNITLDDVSRDYQKLLFTVSIFNAEEFKQTFGRVSNAFTRLVDIDTGREIVRFNLTGDYSTDTFLFVGELVRNGDNSWAFHTIGQGSNLNLLTFWEKYR